MTQLTLTERMRLGYLDAATFNERLLLSTREVERGRREVLMVSWHHYQRMGEALLRHLDALRAS